LLLIPLGQQYIVQRPLPDLLKSGCLVVPASNMKHRIRYPPYSASCLLNPEAIFRVLKNGEGLIKSSDPPMEGSLHAQRAAAGMLKMWRIPGLLQPVVLIMKGMLLRQRRFIEFRKVHSAGDTIKPGQRRRHGREPAFPHDVVGIAKNDRLAVGRFDPDIAGIRPALSLERIDDPQITDSSDILSDDADGVIVRSIVDDDDFPRLGALLTR